jgi:uncharacterized membrane protein
MLCPLCAVLLSVLRKRKKQLFMQDVLELALMLLVFGFRIAIGVMF